MTAYPKFITLGKVFTEVYGISRSAQYKLIRQDRIRKPTRISVKKQGWKMEELEDDLFFGERAKKAEKEMEQEYLNKIYNIQIKNPSERTRVKATLYKQFLEQGMKEIMLEDMLEGRP